MPPYLAHGWSCTSTERRRTYCPTLLQVVLAVAKYHGTDVEEAEGSPPQPQSRTPATQASPMEHETPSAMQNPQVSISRCNSTHSLHRMSINVFCCRIWSICHCHGCEASCACWPQDNAELALRGAALLTRLLVDALDSNVPPPGLLQAAAMLHDNALLVRRWQNLSCRKAFQVVPKRQGGVTMLTPLRHILNVVYVLTAAVLWADDVASSARQALPVTRHAGMAACSWRRRVRRCRMQSRSCAARCGWPSWRAANASSHRRCLTSSSAPSPQVQSATAPKPLPWSAA